MEAGFSQIQSHIRFTEKFIGPFVVACYRLVDINLHDCTKGAVTLVCYLIQTYFKDICIPYKTAILLSYNTNKLVLHLAYIVLAIPLFEEDKMTKFLKKLGYLRNKRVVCHYHLSDY